MNRKLKNYSEGSTNCKTEWQLTTDHESFSCHSRVMQLDKAVPVCTATMIRNYTTSWNREIPIEDDWEEMARKEMACEEKTQRVVWRTYVCYSTLICGMFNSVRRLQFMC
jgi:hypothetical protein